LHEDAAFELHQVDTLNRGLDACVLDVLGAERVTSATVAASFNICSSGIDAPEPTTVAVFSKASLIADMARATDSQFRALQGSRVQAWSSTCSWLHYWTI
jgi:hypothetical protein